MPGRSCAGKRRNIFRMERFNTLLLTGGSTETGVAAGAALSDVCSIAVQLSGRWRSTKSDIIQPMNAGDLNPRYTKSLVSTKSGGIAALAAGLSKDICRSPSRSTCLST